MYIQFIFSKEAGKYFFSKKETTKINYNNNLQNNFEPSREQK
jgi:hypothetical protein